MSGVTLEKILAYYVVFELIIAWSLNLYRGGAGVSTSKREILNVDTRQGTPGCSKDS